VNARSPEFEQTPAVFPKDTEIIFIFGIELSDAFGDLTPQQAVDTDHPLGSFPVPVKKKEVVEMGIKPVPLEPERMIHVGTVSTEFLHKDPIP